MAFRQRLMSVFSSQIASPSMDTSSDGPPAEAADLETACPRNDLHTNAPNSVPATPDVDLEAQDSTTSPDPKFSYPPHYTPHLSYTPYRRVPKRPTAQPADISVIPPAVVKSIQKDNPSSGNKGQSKDGPPPSTNHGRSSAQPPKSSVTRLPPSAAQQHSGALLVHGRSTDGPPPGYGRASAPPPPSTRVVHSSSPIPESSGVIRLPPSAVQQQPGALVVYGSPTDGPPLAHGRPSAHPPPSTPVVHPSAPIPESSGIIRLPPSAVQQQPGALVVHGRPTDGPPLVHGRPSAHPPPSTSVVHPSAPIPESSGIIRISPTPVQQQPGALVVHGRPTDGPPLAHGRPSAHPPPSTPVVHPSAPIPESSVVIRISPTPVQQQPGALVVHGRPTDGSPPSTLTIVPSGPNPESSGIVGLPISTTQSASEQSGSRRKRLAEEVQEEAQPSRVRVIGHIADLRQECDQEINHQLTKDRQTMDSMIIKYQTDLVESQKQVQVLREQLQKERQDAKARSKDLEDTIADHEQTSRGLEVTIRNQQDDLSKVMAKLQGSETKSKTLKEGLARLQSEQKELTASRATVTDLEAKLANLDSQTTQTIDHLKSELQKANNTIQGLNQQHAQSISSSSAANTDIQTLRNEIDELRTRIANDDIERRNLQEEIDDLKNRNVNLSAMEERLKSQHEQALMAVKKGNEKQNAQAKADYKTSLANKVDELDELKKQVKTGQDRIAVLESRESQHLQDAASLRNALETEKGKNTTMEERSSHFTNPALSNQREASRQRLAGLNKRNGLRSSIVQNRQASMPPSLPTRPSTDDDMDIEDTSTPRSRPQTRQHSAQPGVPPNTASKRNANTTQPLSDDDAEMYLPDIPEEEQESARVSLRSPSPTSGRVRYRVPGVFPSRYSSSPSPSAIRYTVERRAQLPDSQASNSSTPSTSSVRPPGFFRRAAETDRHTDEAASRNRARAPSAPPPPATPSHARIYTSSTSTHSNQDDTTTSNASNAPPWDQPSASLNVTDKFINCIEDLSDSVKGLRADIADGRSPLKKKVGHLPSPYKERASGRPRTSERTELTNAVRIFLRECLDLPADHRDKNIFHDISEAHLADPEEVERYQDHDREPPDMEPFKLDFEKPKVLWNLHMADLFADALLARKPALQGQGQKQAIVECFLARIVTLKDHMVHNMPRPGESQADCDARVAAESKRDLDGKRSRSRQTKLFGTRVDSCVAAGRADLAECIETLGEDGMSSDESDGPGVRLVKLMPWRNPKMVNAVTDADKLLPKQNVYGGRRPGAQPDIRIRPRQGQHVSAKPAPKQLPSNYYHSIWFNTKTDLELKLLEPKDQKPFPGEHERIDPASYQ